MAPTTRSSDVVIVGAGPAGATAALVLARAGVRVTLLDRARFPRDKLCGDTLNPGTLRLLRRLGIEEEVTRGAVPLQGMRLTGPSGASVDGRYPNGLHGLALPRREFDDRMVRAAVAAGAAFEEGVKVDGVIVGTDGPGDEGAGVAGVKARSAAGAAEWRARVTIAADGRSSVVAATMGLSRRSASPARWAIGAYYEGATGVGSLGEMHVRTDGYIGVAPLPGNLANAILVIPLAGARQAEAPVKELLASRLASDPLLGPRFASARPVRPPSILGPMAVGARASHSPGLLLAGDAAGFIDPMTGDGMRFAIAGGELAARAALDALEHGWTGLHQRHAARRRRAFGRKQAFNRGMRALTSSAAAVRSLDALAPLLWPLFSRLVSYAGDVDV